MPQSAASPPPAVDPLGQLERPPILIVGDHHSGATWVSDLLSAHPQVAGISELRLFSGMGLEPLFRNYHWNPESSERMFDRRMGLGQFLTRERVVADLRALADRWLARTLSPAHRFLVERSPIGGPGVRAFMELYPDGLVIWVLRDGRTVAQSILAEQRRRWQPTQEAPTPPAGWRMMWSLGTSWAAHVKQVQELGRQAPESFQTLRYEDIQRRVRPSARQIFAICGIPCDEGLLDQFLETVGPPAGSPSRAWTRLEHILYQAGAGESLQENGYSRAPAPGIRLVRQALLAYERAKGVI